MRQVTAILIVLTNDRTGCSLWQDHKKSALVQVQRVRGASLQPLDMRAGLRAPLALNIQWRRGPFRGFACSFNNFADHSHSDQIYDFVLLPKPGYVEQSQVLQYWPPRSRLQNPHIRINAPL